MFFFRVYIPFETKRFDQLTAVLTVFRTYCVCTSYASKKLLFFKYTSPSSLSISLSLSLSLSLSGVPYLERNASNYVQLRVPASKATHLRWRIVTGTPLPFLYTSIPRAPLFSNILCPKLRGRNVRPFYFANFHPPPELYRAWNNYHPSIFERWWGFCNQPFELDLLSMLLTRPLVSQRKSHKSTYDSMFSSFI